MNRLNFNVHNRLVKRADFTVCYDQGRRYHSRHFILFVKVDAAQPAWQMGLAVSRKCGNAVARNRIKRVLREFFRLNQSLIPEAVKIVVVPKRHLDVSRLTMKMAEEELLPVLEEIRRTPSAFSRQTCSQGLKA